METMHWQMERDGFGLKQTLGKLSVFDVCDELVFDCHTLELPWRNNKRRISCIPTGVYLVRKRWSATFGHHFHITDVEGRTWILVHAGNFVHDTSGCVLVGEELTDINGDGLRDVTNSRDTLDKLLAMMPDEFKLKVKNA